MDRLNRVRWNAVGLALVLSLAGASATASAQATHPATEELAWVGLFNGELLAWIDNVNVMEQLCGQRPGSEAFHACRESHLLPRLLVIPVRAGPRTDALRLGELVVLAQPGSELRAYVSADGRVEPFTPDLFLGDWGYGPPYFHQTILERRDPWFRVPVPVIGAGWINGDEWRGRSARYPHVELLQVDGSVVTTPRGDMVVLAVEDRALRARPEQEADMWCRPGDPPPMTPWREVRIPFEELFDASGHLVLSYKYMKGC